MMVESWSNILLIILAAITCYVGYTKLKKTNGSLRGMLISVILASVVLGVAELFDLLQVFPDGTLMADLLYEKEILVLALLLWGISQVKGGKS